MPLDKILTTVQNNPAISGLIGGAAGGALVSSFTNKKSAKKLLKAGGLVAVGGLAYKAYQTYRQNQQPAVAEAQALPDIPQESFEAVVDTEKTAVSSSLIMQAMIAAAHADGHLSNQEQQKIWQQAVSIGLPSTQLSTLNEQLAKPMTINTLNASANNLETKIEIYTASLLVIDEHCASGQIYLADLASQLALPPPLVQALHSQAQQPQIAA